MGAAGGRAATRRGRTTSYAQGSGAPSRPVASSPSPAPGRRPGSTGGASPGLPSARRSSRRRRPAWSCGPRRCCARGAASARCRTRRRRHRLAGARARARARAHVRGRVPRRRRARPTTSPPRRCGASARRRRPRAARAPWPARCSSPDHDGAAVRAERGAAGRRRARSTLKVGGRRADGRGAGAARGARSSTPRGRRRSPTSCTATRPPPCSSSSCARATAS